MLVKIAHPQVPIHPNPMTKCIPPRWAEGSQRTARVTLLLPSLNCLQVSGAPPNSCVQGCCPAGWQGSLQVSCQLEGGEEPQICSTCWARGCAWLASVRARVVCPACGCRVGRVCAPCTLTCILGVWAGHASIEGQ